MCIRDREREDVQRICGFLPKGEEGEVSGLWAVSYTHLKAGSRNSPFGQKRLSVPQAGRIMPGYTNKQPPCIFLPSFSSAPVHSRLHRGDCHIRSFLKAVSYTHLEVADETVDFQLNAIVDVLEKLKKSSTA